MDPPAVTTCSSTSNGTMGSSSASAEAGSQHRQGYHLRIDPGSFNSSRTYEELPENFLETISPQQSTAPSSSIMMNEHSSSPQLAPLAPMSMASEQSGSYMMGIGGPGQYAGHTLEKTSFGNGPAGLLSPLHLDSRRAMAQSNYGDVYIKEETDVLDQSGHHMLLQSQMPISSQQQELDRIGQAETPPAVSNVELASTMIATLIGEQRSSTPPNHNMYNSGPSSLMQQRIANMKHDAEDPLESMINGDAESEYQRQAFASKGNRRVYSTKDNSDPLNAEIDDDVYIDTRDLCKRIAFELKQHSIPQAIFAERILCRSQGTLSDLLRNPKPWNKLKSGRETFRRMFNWVQQPLTLRLGILDMYKTEGPESEGLISNGIVKGMGMAPPTPAQNVRNSTRRSTSDDGPANKRPRLVFTDIQKRTLQAIFKETQRPSREMQQTIAEHLRLDLSTVANFFMNARRRSRVGPGPDDAGPAPFQMVHNVSPPPPDSPTHVGSVSRRRVPACMQHVEATVSSVADSAIEYSRGQHHLSLDDDDAFKMYKQDEQLGDEEAISIIAPPNEQDWSENHVVEVVHSESLTPLEDSPVDVEERVKQEDEEADDVAASQR